jgi:hypothetical protein
VAVNVRLSDAHTFDGEKELEANTERTETRRKRAVIDFEPKKRKREASKGGRGSTKRLG